MRESRGARKRRQRRENKVFDLNKELTKRAKTIAKLESTSKRWPNGPDLNFALSLLQQYRAHGNLTDRQWHWARKLASRKQPTIDPSLVPSKFKERRYKVYMIRAGDYIKIGYSHDPDARLKSMETGNPLSMEIIWQQDMGPVARTAKLAESRLHTRFEKHRHKGEWFHAEPVIALLQESYEDMVPDYDELNLVYQAQKRI